MQDQSFFNFFNTLNVTEEHLQTLDEEEVNLKPLPKFSLPFSSKKPCPNLPCLNSLYSGRRNPKQHGRGSGNRVNPGWRGDPLLHRVLLGGRQTGRQRRRRRRRRRRQRWKRPETQGQKEQEEQWQKGNWTRPIAPVRVQVIVIFVISLKMVLIFCWGGKGFAGLVQLFLRGKIRKSWDFISKFDLCCFLLSLWFCRNYLNFD